MEDEEELQNHPPPPPPPPPPNPNQNGRYVQPVTVAAPPPQNILTLALPIQQPRSSSSAAATGGGGREDCWSEGATSTLIDAWGERYLELSRGNLKQQHWKDVADVVSSRQDYTKPPKTDVQCKNRIDTLKKKYKSEKAKIASGQGDSKWIFFHRLDRLLGTSTPTLNSIANSKIPLAIPVNLPPNSFYKSQYQRPGLLHSDSSSDNPPSPESSDSLPPDTVNHKRPRVDQNADKGKSWGDSMRELTRAILEFGEVYERMETTKLQQELEMEKHRRRFAKELEAQRMQLLMKTQLELLQLMHGGKNSKKGKNSKNSSSHQQEKNKNKSSKFD